MYNIKDWGNNFFYSCQPVILFIIYPEYELRHEWLTYSTSLYLYWIYTGKIKWNLHYPILYHLAKPSQILLIGCLFVMSCTYTLQRQILEFHTWIINKITVL